MGYAAGFTVDPEGQRLRDLDLHFYPQLDDKIYESNLVTHFMSIIIVMSEKAYLSLKSLP